ncbi:MAG TPA: O-antigen ligase family protein [Acidimicrobiales bacterium]|nr:O-antigen ligase family protein [Acidimicrobiales bacterium]
MTAIARPWPRPQGPLLARAVVPAALVGAAAVPALALRTGRVTVALGAALAGLFVLLVRFRAEVLVAAVIAMSVTTLTAGFPLGVEVAGFRLAVYDVLLVAAVVIALERPAPFHLGPLLPIAVAATAMGVVLGKVNGAAIDVQVDEARSVAYLLAGLALSRYLTCDRLLQAGSRLVAGVLWVSLAVVLANLVVGVAIAASEGQAHLARGTSGAGSSAVEFGATRYVTVTTHLALLVLAALLAYAALPGDRPVLRIHRGLLVALLVPAAVLVVFSFSRNTVLGLVAALLFTLVATRSLRSYVDLAIRSVAAVATLVLVSLLLFPAPTQEVAATFAGRVLAGTSADALAIDSGVQFRQIESELALTSLRENPLVGIGFGTSYRPDLAQDPFPADASDYARSYVHNWYLWLATKLGVIGAVPIIAILVVALARSLVGTPSQVVLASGLAAIVAVGVVWSTLREAGMALVIGLIAGCLSRPEPEGAISGHRSTT